MRRRISLAVALLLAAAPATAQHKEATPYDRAIAAGYKALTLCSGIFNAGRTQAGIEAIELRGIYPEYDAIVPTLAATVDRQLATVTVAFDTAVPPRRAVWSTDMGCSIEPIGAVAPPVVTSYRTSPAPAAANPRAWPTGDAGGTAKAPPRLLPAIARAFDSTSFGQGSETTAVLVIRDGKIVAERYREGFGPYVSQRTWSVAKSLAGTLVGTAVARLGVDVAKPALIPEWEGEWSFNLRRRITLDNLLRMASGLHSDTAGNRTDAVYFGGTSVNEETTGWPVEAPPGTRFRYANNDILLAVRSLRAALGDKDYADLPRAALFDKLGMAHTVAETDWRGNYILSSQVWSTARDLARFGMLYLNDGVWNGERILPQGWVKYVTTPSGPQPEGAFGYGATFWLINNSPGVPADAFAAFGNRGQYVVIVPSRDIVIVRRGEDPAGARFDIAKFTADILAALK